MTKEDDKNRPLWETDIRNAFGDGEKKYGMLPAQPKSPEPDNEVLPARRGFPFRERITNFAKNRKLVGLSILAATVLAASPILLNKNLRNDVLTEAGIDPLSCEPFPKICSDVSDSKRRFLIYWNEPEVAGIPGGAQFEISYVDAFTNQPKKIADVGKNRLLVTTNMLPATPSPISLQTFNRLSKITVLNVEPYKTYHLQVQAFRDKERLNLGTGDIFIAVPPIF